MSPGQCRVLRQTPRPDDLLKTYWATTNDNTLSFDCEWAFFGERAAETKFKGTVYTKTRHQLTKRSP